MCIKCTVKNCMSEGVVRVDLYKRGGHSAYLCEYHAEHLEDYNRENTYQHGKKKVNGFTFGVELETSNSDLKGRVELADAGYIPTYDCTVDVEFKSPIYNGMNAIVKQLLTIDRLIADEHLEIGNGCGTHFHVGHSEYINETTLDYVRRFYHSLFIPLCNAMQADQSKTRRIFGRYFTHYAQPINTNTRAMQHEIFINLQHTYSIEFRLCKFQNAAQYTKLIHFCKDITSAIINNFILHFNDTEIDNTRYKNITAYRKHKAQITAKKIVNLWEKL